MYGFYKPYVSVAERRKKAAKVVSQMIKKGEKVAPISIEGRVIAKTFWGKSWCSHLEAFSDYENRLPRGRTYVRNGSVIHLSMDVGKIEALVQGSSLYKVGIAIQSVDPKKWQDIVGQCSGEIQSMVELLQGKLSSSVMKTITNKENGLFPKPKEITLTCSCPDGAYMCKHVAAVLYGVGARLDQEPELLFKLRHVDHLDLMDYSKLKAPAKNSTLPEVFEGEDLSDLFGIEIESGESLEVNRNSKTAKAPKAISQIAPKKSTKKALPKKKAEKVAVQNKSIKKTPGDRPSMKKVLLLSGPVKKSSPAKSLKPKK